MITNINSKDDIANHKDYILEQEHWLADLKDPVIQQHMANNFQSAAVFDETFTQEEIDWIYGFAFSRCTTVRHNDNGTMFISGNLQGVYEKFADRINKMIPGAENSPCVGGNFFITPSQYGLHNDSTRESDWVQSLERTPRDSDRRKWVPWRNMIIPLFTAPSGINSHATFFDQRHADFAHVYHHGKRANQTVATTYPIADDHGKLDFHLLDGTVQSKEDNLRKYNVEHHEEYLYYTPYKRLTGLTPELTCEWKPASPVVFDAVQLHATNKGFKDQSQWTTKMGLLLTFLKEVPQ
jgi:hypothetical protein|tara:strand:- start:31 stop:915 length:885 start_codon:yes stop_codon:yes gene_type:complete